MIEGAAVRSAEEARAFLAAIGAPIMLKAVAGGGGRGMRAVRDEAEDRRGLRPLPVRGRRRLRRRALYVERLIERARHIEVQILGDRHGGARRISASANARSSAATRS